MEKQGRRVLKLKQNFVAGKVAQGKTLKKQLTPWKVLYLSKLSKYIIPFSCQLPRQLAKKLSSQQTRISTEANQGFQKSWKSQVSTFMISYELKNQLAYN